jgi:ABC-type Na+ efflux pump permease subunit
MLVVLTVGWQIVGWIVFAGGTYWGMKRFKDERGGIITYFRALNAGFQTAFFASVILAFAGYMSVTLDPSLITAMLDATKQQLLSMEVPSGLVEIAIQQWREILTPVVFGLLIIFMYSAMGCFISILCAFFIKTAKPGEFVDF